METKQHLGDLKAVDFKAWVQESAETPRESRVVDKIVETIKRCPVDDFNGLNVRLLKDANNVTPVAKRNAFVSRIIATLNARLNACYKYPKRLYKVPLAPIFPSEGDLANSAQIIPALIHRSPPGMLKLALLLTHRVGVTHRSVLNSLEIGWLQITNASELHVAISKHDKKHSYVVQLPDELADQIGSCLAKLKPAYPDGMATSALKAQLNHQLGAIVTKNVSPKDRSPGAAELRAVQNQPDWDIKSITLTKLFKASYMYGAAAYMPGELRDMLMQKTLPVSTDRISLFKLDSREIPISPNFEVKHPSPADELLDNAAQRQYQRIEFLSGTDSVPEETWVQNRAVVRNALGPIFEARLDQETKGAEIGRILYEKNRVNPNSWWAWAVKFLFHEGIDKKWKSNDTYKQYLSLLLPKELMAIPSIVNTSVFDQDDLMQLFDSLENASTKEEQLHKQINLIWRMINFAKQRPQMDAFWEVEDLRNKKEGTLNKRAHILTPSELEGLIIETYDSGKKSEALVLTLAGFLGMRPIEIMHLRREDLTLVHETVEINIMLSKTIAGRRKLPAEGFVSSRLYPLLIDMLEVELESNRGRDLFCDDRFLLHKRRMEVIQPAMDLLRKKFGNGIDMYTLRHGFASWSYLRLSKLTLIDSPLWNTSPALQHSLFTKDLEKFRRLAFSQCPENGDPEAFYRLCRFMGHATQHTLPTTYIHTAGIAHAAFLALRTG